MNHLKIITYFNSELDKLALYKSDPEGNSFEHNHEFDELVIFENIMSTIASHTSKSSIMH